MTLYGIKNCNTVKKAASWLEENHISFEFHDYRKQSISQEKLQDWSRQVGIDDLINRKGTTWRKLDEAQKEKAKDENQALEIMASQTSVIRRPILEQDGKIVAIGFNEDEYNSMLCR